MAKYGADSYRVLFERSADASLIIDGERFVDCNDAAVELLRYASRDELLRMHPSEISPEYQPDGRKSFEKANDMMATAFERGSHRFEWDHLRADGEAFPVEVLLTAVPFEDRQVLYVVWRDISERKQAEEVRARLVEQLHQAQKMDAIGQLAGGIAHDFNNILTAILGNIELQLSRYERGAATLEGLVKCLQEIERGSNRAASLTHQLLAFSRQQMSQPQVLDLRTAVAGLEEMFHRLLTEDIDLKVKTPKQLKGTWVDPAQFEQVVVNLVVNARDAMPDGGKIFIELSDIVLDRDYVANFGEARIGPHVVLTVSDTGTGMDADTQKRIFEPFFTTKEVGRGTGLGLATVFGIVKQTGGHVTVYSEPGGGSTFRVYLPACDDTVPTQKPRVESQLEPPSGDETVLVCEDDASVRQLATDILATAGYKVHAASGGTEALELVAGLDAPVHLLVTDVIMPDMNGRQLADALLERDPSMQVLYMSGYTDDVIAHRGVLEKGVAFLEKPFSRRKLLVQVRRILAERPGPS